MTAIQDIGGVSLSFVSPYPSLVPLHELASSSATSRLCPTSPRTTTLRPCISIPLSLTRGGRSFIVNIPGIFSSLWGIVKPFLHERTVKKIHIYSNNYYDDLYNAVDTRNIPVCPRLVIYA